MSEQMLLTQKEAAKSLKIGVRTLVEATATGTAPDADTCRWLSKIEERLAEKLAKVELIAPRTPTEPDAATTLDAAFTAYLTSHTDVKPGTKFNLDLTRRNLVEFFGADKALTEVTRGDADEWRRWLKRATPSRPGELKPPKLAENTIRRRCGRAREFFTWKTTASSEIASAITSSRGKKLKRC
jgi:hypothetical protein